MFINLRLIIVVLIIVIIIIIILNLISKKTFSDKEKRSPFECGFDPKNNARIPFSIQFFLIAIIFLIFDVEIALIIPIIKIIKSSNYIILLLTSNLFIIILIIGLYHEWNQGALTWLK